MSQKVSIITPLYNRLNLIPETWASIKKQSYVNWEWIVVDDGSTDDGDKYIQNLSKSDHRVHLYRRDKGFKGPSGCRNLGIQKSTGHYLLFLDSDDILSPHCLQKRVAFLEQQNDLDFAVFTQAIFNTVISNKQPIFNKFFSNKEEYLKAFISDQHPWQTSGPLWKKESLVKTGGFREDYTIMEDPELHIRAILLGLQFKVIKEEPDFYYRLLPKTKEQEEQFRKNSIIGRIAFYKDLYPKINTELRKQAISQGIINLYKTFLLAKIDHFQTEHRSLKSWIIMERILPRWKILLITCYNTLKTNPIINRIPYIKGCIFKYI
jgi:glycosyltransferase involved in cell wall biosynthesis